MSIFGDPVLFDGKVPSPSDATPQDLGTAEAGTSTDYSRADHVHKKPTYSASDVGAQPTVAVSGILKGDGLGGISAATAGTDYGTYSKPSGGIPASDLASDVIPSRVPVYGMGKNLLRNWYFINPVNQRGQSSYGTSGQYTIDGWYASYGTGGVNVAIINGGISIAPVDSESHGMFAQLIEEYLLAALIDMPVTGSVLFSNGTLLYGTVSSLSDGAKQTLASDTISGARTDIFIDTRIAQRRFLIDRYTTSITVVAAKFELGTEQTLCHNEGTVENPVWVLNEIPEYEEELVKCQTSTADVDDTYANKSLATKQDLAPIQATGTTNTTGSTITAGTYFYLNGVLVQARTNIASGATFTSGTNYRVVTAGLLNEILTVVNGTNITTTVPNKTSTNVMSIELTPGTWLLYGALGFSTANTDYGVCSFQTSDFSNPYPAAVRGKAESATQFNPVSVITIPDTLTTATIYLSVYQASGAEMTVNSRALRAVKLR